MSFVAPLPTATGRTPLTRRQKAAVVVHLLVSGGADPGVRDLPVAQQRQLVRDMASLRFIDRETLAEVIGEFAQELDGIGLHIPRDPARLLQMLDSQLSVEVVDQLMAELGESATPGDGAWQSICELPPEEMVAFLEHESDDVGAILLSKLPAERAATVLRLLPEDRGERLAIAFARTDGVSPASVARIGLALSRETSQRKAPAFAVDGAKRVANILNAATSSIRRGILDTLDSVNPDFAAGVRAAVFSFENIPDRVDPRDMPRVLRNIENTTLITALAGLPEDQAQIADFMLGTISKRMADQIREDIADRDTPTAAELEEATGAIVAAIRQMEEDGDLVLNVPDTET